MDRRSERDSPPPLIIHIMGQVQIPRTLGVGSHPVQESLTQQDERHPGESLDTFPCGTGHHIDVRAGDVDRFAAQSAHGVHDKYAVLAVDDLGDLLDGVEEPRGGFMVDHRHRMDFGMLPERQPQPLRVWTRRPIHFQFGHTEPMQTDHVRDALAVDAVIEHQHALPDRQA